MLNAKLSLVQFFNLLMFGFILLIKPVYADTHVIKICSDPWQPWVTGNDGELASGGYAVEISEQLFSRMGLKTEIMIFPYKRCINQMKNGERDVLLMVKKTAEREKFLQFSDEVIIDPQLVYYSSERFKDFNWDSWEDFKGYTIGGVLGFNYGDFQSQAEKLNLNVELAPNDSNNIKKLLSGRLDFILLSRSTARDLVLENPARYRQLKAASKVVSNAHFHFGLSKKGNAVNYLGKMNDVIREMKRDGTIRRIVGD